MDNTDSYRLNPIGSCSDDVVRIGHVSSAATKSELQRGPVASNYLQLDAPEPDDSGSDTSDRFIKSQIANHPLYPNLVSAFIECHKVGAPPELASLLEEIRREKPLINAPLHIGDDPQLDDFMESYCGVLHRYKEELFKPFNEATLFLSNIESQLTNLCKGTFTTSSSPHRLDEGGGSSEKERSGGEAEAVDGDESRRADQELKDMLLRKYSGYLSSLRKEFLKKRNKGKLPKDARMALLHWWNCHYRWPYPTEEEKLKLSEITGLDQKQINNWFINQRKRHWKPSEDMRFTVMGGVSGGDINGGGRGPVYFNSGGGGRTST